MKYILSRILVVVVVVWVVRVCKKSARKSCACNLLSGTVKVIFSMFEVIYWKNQWKTKKGHKSMSFNRKCLHKSLNNGSFVWRLTCLRTRCLHIRALFATKRESPTLNPFVKSHWMLELSGNFQKRTFFMDITLNSNNYPYNTHTHDNLTLIYAINC